MRNSEYTSLIATIIALIIMVVGVLTYNIRSGDIWNGGVCELCDQRFVVVKARGDINWYACPDCGQEVKRIVWF